MTQASLVDAPTIIPCAHCGLTVDVAGMTTAQLQQLVNVDAPSDYTDAPNRPSFCCYGCMGAYALIHEFGLDDFYGLRRSSAYQPRVEVRGDESIEVLRDLDQAGVAVERDATGRCQVRLSIDGIHCAACSWLIENLPATLQGFESARVRMGDQSVELVYDPAHTSPVEIAQRLIKLGYRLSPMSDEPTDSIQDQRLQREHWVGIATAFFIAANAMWIGIALYAGERTGMSDGNEQFLRWIGAGLGLLAALFPGQIFFRSAWMALRTRTSHVDIPVALALGVGTCGSIAGAAWGRGHIYFDSLASLVLLLRIGRYVQFRSQHRTGHSIRQLLRSNLWIAHKLDPDGTRRVVPASRLSPGDEIEVMAGQVIPADGVLSGGRSAIQTALLTGESHPRPVGPGDQVAGGCINLGSPIRIQVSAVGVQSRVGQMMELVRHATTDRTPLVRRADRIGGWFVAIVLVSSAISWLVWFERAGIVVATQHTIAMLTIACPCALAIAAPLVITIALGRAAREQIWIRSGECLERLATPGHLWFDKTGTLTCGQVRVEHWSGAESDLVKIGALESCSQHVIARPIAAYCERTIRSSTPLRVEHVQQVDGHGIEGTVDGQQIVIGNRSFLENRGIEFPSDLSDAIDRNNGPKGWSMVWAAIDRIPCGYFAIGDSLRPHVARMLKALSDRGWTMGILSGDEQSAVDRVADSLRSGGVPLTEVLGEMSPEHKLQKVVASRAQNRGPVVMVGDGVNDAPALAAASVGIALKGNSMVSLRNAPVFIPEHPLESIVDLVDASRGAVRAIYCCFAVSLIYNAVTLTLAALGWIHPWIAAILMPISGLTVLAIAFRAKTFVRHQGIRS